MPMFSRFRLWLGPTRLQALFILLATTGLSNLILNAAAQEDTTWISSVQNALVVIFVVGVAIIIGSRLDGFERGRWLGLLAPAFGLVLIGTFFMPDRLLLFMGGALGWILAGMFLFKPRGPMAYSQAIKAFRKNDYQEATGILTELIRLEPNVPEHYRLRAEFFRVWGKLDRARKDYRKVADLLPDHWVGYHGLAEVEFQQHNLDAARSEAQRAHQIAPDQWVISYNLGMIEDRANRPGEALRYFDSIIQQKNIDNHYLFLIHFYRARNHARLGDQAAAAQAVKQMKGYGRGLNQWQIILQSDQADTLRAVLESDIRAAERLFNDQADIASLVA